MHRLHRLVCVLVCVCVCVHVHVGSARAARSAYESSTKQRQGGNDLCCIHNSGRRTAHTKHIKINISHSVSICNRLLPACLCVHVHRLIHLQC